MKFGFENKIILENKRVRLEPMSMIHHGALSEIVLKTPDILKYSPPKFGTEELLTAYMDTNIGLRAKEEKYPFVIYDKLVGRYAGSTSFMNISNKNSRLEIGSTWIGVDFQRTGLNRNCKFLLITYAFEQLNVERLELKTDARNTQSREAIVAIGGKYEGQLRSHTLMSDGYRRDTVYYSILKEEWPEIKKMVFANF